MGKLRALAACVPSESPDKGFGGRGALSFRSARILTGRAERAHLTQGMEDIWAEGAASLFFSVSGISKLLSGEEGPPSLAAILSEDDVIQETQAQSSKLIEL